MSSLVKKLEALKEQNRKAIPKSSMAKRSKLLSRLFKIVKSAYPQKLTLEQLVTRLENDSIKIDLKDVQ